MLVYLDTKDLIDLLEGHGAVDIDDFEAVLRGGTHKLAVSFTAVREVAAPLVEKHARSNVMRLLTRLEHLPLRFINEARVHKLELREAIRAFSEGSEYKPICPFVDRFDQTVDLDAAPSTQIYLHYSVAETVFDLWRISPELFRVRGQHLEALQRLMKDDRVLKNPPSMKRHFRTKVRRDLQLYGLQFPAPDSAPLADWIYWKPVRCPASRLGYEVFHALRRNPGDVPEGSDFGDFGHLACLPYVDVLTLDRRMCGYVSQVTRSLGIDYGARLFSGLPQIHAALTL